MTYFEPLLPICTLLAAAGAVQLWRSRGHERRLVLIAVVCFFIISWPPLEWLFSRPLESGYRSAPPDRSAQAMVVLASRFVPAHDDLPFDMLGEDTYQRCLRAAWLYRHWAQRPILVSGFRVAPVMHHVLAAEGIPPADIWDEISSNDTHTNAVESARLLRERGVSRIVLVADARDLPRAAACFRKQGITVLPYPSSLRTFSFDEWLPNWHSIRSNEHTLHELAGMAWYKLRGWI